MDKSRSHHENGNRDDQGNDDEKWKAMSTLIVAMYLNYTSAPFALVRVTNSIAP